jgi:CheY-like chemotaxis protein
MISILLVDDDPDILEVIRLDLEEDPAFVVDTCGTSAEALKKVQTNRYDVIVTDWRMPVMNGTQLIRAFRADNCTSQIILYSGHNLGPDIRMALESGASHVIYRGGDPDSEFAELREKIRHLVHAETDLLKGAEMNKTPQEYHVQPADRKN